MTRRVALLALTLSVLLAGCSGLGAESPPAGTDLDAEISFPSCTSVHVEAEEYERVLIAVQGGQTIEFTEGYSGSQTFETDAAIDEVLVTAGDRSASAINPAYRECKTTATPS